MDVPSRAESGKIEVATIHGTVRSSDDFFVVPPGLSAANIAVTGRLAFGQPRSVSLAVAGQKAMLLFDGTAGQKVSLQIGPSTITSASASILAPGNATVATGSFNSAGGLVDAFILPVSGTYAVLINPSGTAFGNPAITLHTFTDVSGGLIPGGAAVQVTTTVPGQNAVLAFNGSAGQRISALVSGASFSMGNYLYMSLRKPDGSVMVDSQLVTSSGAFLDTQTLPVNGTYTLLLNPRESSLVKATIQLYDVPADLSVPAAVGGVPVQIATTAPGQNATIVFNGVAGQRISALVNGVTLTGVNNLNMSLYKPDGSVLVNSVLVTSSGAFLDAQTLPVSGTYTLLLNPKESSLIKATIQLYSVPAELSVPAVIGGVPVQIATTAPGQNAAIAFDGVAGQRISILVNGVSFTGGSYLYMSLRKPDGSAMITPLQVTSSGTFLDTQTLPVSGTYLLHLDPKEASLVQQAKIQLFDVPASVQMTATIGGTAAGIATTVPGQNASLAFNGRAGQSVSIAITNNTMGCILLEPRKPDGGTLMTRLTCSASATFTPLVLPASGNYSIDINPKGANIGAINIRITSP